MKAFFPAVLLFVLSQSTTFADVPVNPDHLPHFFEVVKGEVYRGAQPTEAGFRDLAQMNAKTVLNLRKESNADARHEGNTVRSLGMNYIYVPLSGIWRPADDDMNFVEATLNRNDLKPIFVHCEHGKDRTGLAVGLYRVFTQHESPKDAYKEMVDLGFSVFSFGLREYFEDKTGYDP